MKKQTKMKASSLLGKKIRVSVDGHKFYYSISEIIELDNTHILFKDKFGHMKGIRLRDILEIYE